MNKELYITTPFQEIFYVTISQGGNFTPEVQDKSEDTLLFLEGKGELQIDGEPSVQIKPETLVHAAGKAHHIFNGHAESLKLFWIRAKVTGEKREGPVYIRQRADCALIIDEKNPGEIVVELWGTNSGGAKAHSVALALIKPGCSSIKHAHTDIEEVYLIQKGHTVLTIGEKTTEAGAGAKEIIPPQTFHQIFNPTKEDAELYVTAAPKPWYYQSVIKA